jgi:hypothetical protein
MWLASVLPHLQALGVSAATASEGNRLMLDLVLPTLLLVSGRIMPLPYPALHALTTGAIGVFTLGMMARVTLGHTGREMRSSGLTNLSFVLANLAAIARVLLPVVMPQGYKVSLYTSGLLWILVFSYPLASLKIP